MPSVKVSRGKRGHHHIALVESSRQSPGGQILFWFRSPPGLKVGRVPFDPETRRSLSARYPNLHFDWARLAEMPMPPPEEPWREQRRADRAAKARAASTGRSSGPDAEPESPSLGNHDEGEADERARDDEGGRELMALADTATTSAGPGEVETGTTVEVGESGQASRTEPAGPPPNGGARSADPRSAGKRRRRRGRRPKPSGPAPAPSTAEPPSPPPPSDESDGSA